MTDQTPEPDVVAAIQAAKERLQSKDSRVDRDVDQLTIEDVLREPDDR